jgi:Mg-chelatase subunit ChlD/sugar lactone lactonase YvrE
MTAVGVLTLAVVMLLPVAGRVDGTLYGPQRAEQALESYRLVATWPLPELSRPGGTFIDPAGVAVDSTGRVYVADSFNARLQVFGADGEFIGAWGPGGALAGLRAPTGLVVVGSSLFVADRAGRVQAFDLAGRMLDEWEGLQAPSDVAVLADGRIVVSQPEGGSLAVLASGGRRLATWQGLAADGAATRPLGISAGPDGRLWVADSASRQLLAVTADGQVVQRRTVERHGRALVPLDITFDGSGDVYVATLAGVLWYDRYWNERFWWPLVGAQAVAVKAPFGLYVTVRETDGAFHGVHRYQYGLMRNQPVQRWGAAAPLYATRAGPRSVAVRRDVRATAVFVLDGAGRVQVFDRSGNLVRQMERPRGAQDLAAGGNDDVYVTYSDETVGSGLARWRQDDTQVWIQTFVPPDSVFPRRWPLTADVASDGNIYVLDSGHLQLLVWRPDRSNVTIWDLDVGPDFQLLWDVAAGEAGRYYIVNRSTRRIEYRSAGGAALGDWSVQGRPVRLASDGRNVFVLTLEGWVWKYGPSGALAGVWEARGPSPDSEVRLTDLAVDGEGRVYVTDRGYNRVYVYERDPQAVGEVPPPPAEGSCQLIGDKTVQPDTIEPGQQVEVTLTVRGSCPDVAEVGDIMLVLDRSESMASDGKIQAAKDAAIAFVQAIDFSRERVGVVSFSTDATLDQSLTNDRAAVIAAIQGIAVGGSTNLAAAVSTAQAELGARRRPEAKPVIVLLTDGRPRGVSPSAVLQQAEDARAAGTHIFTIGFGQAGDIDEFLLMLMASDPTDYFRAPTNDQLRAIYAEIARRLSATVLAKQASLTDLLAPNMRYVAGSGSPPPAVSAQTLSWQLADVPFVGVTLRYRVEPQTCGRHPVNELASLDYVDGLGSRGTLVFPVPFVSVTNCATATFTITPTPTRTPTPTPQPTREPIPAYLPAVHKCIRETRHADVALVLDSSTSMSERTTPGGPTKLEAAQRAATLFLNRLQMPRDRAVLVVFNSDAQVLQPLTGDRAQLVARLANLPQGAGTRIDKGIEAGHGALAAPTANNRVLVLLTDGRPSGVTNELVLAEADRAKRSGIIIYTIGLGSDVDAALLRGVASAPDYYFFAPGGDDLERIYTAIAFSIPCRVTP